MIYMNSQSGRCAHSTFTAQECAESQVKGSSAPQRSNRIWAGQATASKHSYLGLEILRDAAHNANPLIGSFLNVCSWAEKELLLNSTVMLRHPRVNLTAKLRLPSQICLNTQGCHRELLPMKEVFL